MGSNLVPTPRMYFERAFVAIVWLGRVFTGLRLTLRIGCAVAQKKAFITNQNEGK